MKSKIRLTAIIGTLALAASSLIASEGAYFVKLERENLRSTPSGDRIGQVLQRAEVKVIEEKGDWFKVTVTAWIPKASLTTDPSTIQAAHRDAKPAGSGFFYSNVSISTGMLGTQCLGEMTNNSDRDYTFVNFIVSVYDENEKLIETADIIISNFAKDDKKSFEALLIDSQASQIASYKIQFENGM